MKAPNDCELRARENRPSAKSVGPSPLNVSISTSSAGTTPPQLDPHRPFFSMLSSPFTLDAHYRKADRIMLGILWLMFVYSIVLGLWHDAGTEAVLVGGTTLGLMHLLHGMAAGRRWLRCCMAVAFMAFAALHIDLSHGVVEMHFGIFVLLAILVFYRDWLPIVVAAAAIAIHHLAFFALQQQGVGVHVVHTGGWPVVFLHAFYVVLETAILVYLAVQSQAEARGAMTLLTSVSYLTSSEVIDLSHRSQDTGKVTSRFNHFLERLDELVGVVVRDTLGLNELARQLVSTTRDLRHGARRQLEQTAHISNAMRIMGDTTQSVASNAEEAAHTARGIDQEAQNGTRLMKASAEAINALATQIDASDRQVRDLEARSQLIGNVVETIRGIAEQTNLLALNAAIEAARAGEQGRGFSIVADEVRNLANKTTLATKEIQSAISLLQEDSHKAAAVMEQSRDSVKQCVAHSHQTSELLSRVACAIATISQMNQLIADATQEQNSVGEEIIRHLGDVQDVADHNDNDAQHLEREGTRLQDLSQRLQGLSKRFEISDQAG